MAFFLEYCFNFITVNFFFFFFLYDEEPPSRYGACGTTITTPEGQTLDAYTSPLSRHQVNREIPQLGVELENSGFTVSPGTLPYCCGTLGGGLCLSL